MSFTFVFREHANKLIWKSMYKKVVERSAN